LKFLVPDGQIKKSCPALPRKYFASLLAQIIFIGMPSRPNEGRFAIVMNAGWGCGGREGAFDEQR
jgi:hypothetical protein